MRFSFLPFFSIRSSKENLLLSLQVDLIFGGFSYPGKQTGSHLSCLSMKNGRKICGVHKQLNLSKGSIRACYF